MKFPKPKLDRESAMKLWIEEHSDYAKEQVILNNVGMVGLVLKSLNLNPLDDDLFSVGLIGLVKAVNAFNPDKGIKFSTYAMTVMRNEIFMARRKKRIIPAFSLDESYNLGNGELVDFSEMIADSRIFEEEVIVDMQIKKLLPKLSNREKKIISLSTDGKTRKEIAEILGVTQSCVSKVIKSIYKKWRKQNETL